MGNQVLLLKNWRTDFIYKGNTITGKPVVLIVAHKVKNPNWPEANQLAIYKHDGGAEPGT